MKNNGLRGNRGKQGRRGCPFRDSATNVFVKRGRKGVRPTPKFFHIAGERDAFPFGTIQEAADEEFRVDAFLNRFWRDGRVLFCRRKLLSSNVQVIDIGLPTTTTFRCVLL